MERQKKAVAPRKVDRQRGIENFQVPVIRVGGGKRGKKRGPEPFGESEKTKKRCRERFSCRVSGQRTERAWRAFLVGQRREKA